MYSNGFIFMLIPLSSSLPPIIIHIEISENCSYNELINYIAEFSKKNFASDEHNSFIPYS